jgi:hypothetical protein
MSGGFRIAERARQRSRIRSVRVRQFTRITRTPLDHRARDD